MLQTKLLLENVDAADVIITADHGNPFGEYTIHGHPEGMLLPCVKKVPWVESDAVDKKAFEPTTNHMNVEDNKTKIQDLGYV
ncbi:hypothetical protein ACFQAS_02820 [Halopenitus salinus]|uniref:Metalloenzyme domain-containing protein n=1 Tax=Halopenitus salinus TaxID=1198295 RepID=A0ABD5UQQ3_9EURY